MDIWSLLEIAPTKDIAAIKQAYAAKAKIWHPEEHPEEFKLLREAYRRASAYARSAGRAEGAGNARGTGSTGGEGSTEGTGNARGTGRTEGEGSTGNARSTGSTEGEGSTGNARSTGSTGGAGSTEGAGNARETGSTGGAGSTEDAESIGGAGSEENSRGPEIFIIYWEDGTSTGGGEKDKIFRTEQIYENFEKATAFEKEDFSYEDVNSFYQEDLAEKFFQGFHMIAENPYLQNRKKVWSCFLFRVEYEDLYSHPVFRQRFMAEVCAVFGWRKEIVEYFDWWLGLYQEGEKQDTDNANWQKKKRKTKESALFIETAQQHELHQVLLEMLRGRELDDTLQTQDSIEMYLQCYQSFLRENEDWAEKQRRIRTVLVRRTYLRWGIFWSFVAIFVLQYVISGAMSEAQWKREQKELKRQKAIAERFAQAEEKRQEQEDWRQELAERFQLLQEQYEEWERQP